MKKLALVISILSILASSLMQVTGHTPQIGGGYNIYYNGSFDIQQIY